MSSRRADAARTPTTSGPDFDQWREALRELVPQLRRDLPWAGASPWAVMVSEIMLQQTPVDRVRPYFERFMSTWPTASEFASADRADVLRAWKGLGYPRRAIYLHQAAQVIRDDYAGRVPDEIGQLLALPGIGAYSARAIASFAYGIPVGVLDTNVGRIVARAFYGHAVTRQVAQDAADALASQADAATINQVVLDLGAQVCRSTPQCERCPVAARCVWRQRGGDDPAPASAGVSRPQARFGGSVRELRGRVLAALHDGPRSHVALVREMNDGRTPAALESMQREGLIESFARSWRLGSSPQSE